jgi:hypothetical protein
MAAFSRSSKATFRLEVAFLEDIVAALRVSECLQAT